MYILVCTTHAVHVQYVLYMYCMYYIFFNSLTFQLSFSPRHSGKYQAILNVIHNTGSINHHVSQSPLASIKIEASAEKPRLQILTGNEDTMSLDYGVVLAGKNTSLPFYIVNHGHADVPLRLSFSTVSCLKVEINTFKKKKHPESQMGLKPMSYMYIRLK